MLLGSLVHSDVGVEANSLPALDVHICKDLLQACAAPKLLRQSLVLD